MKETFVSTKTGGPPPVPSSAEWLQVRLRKAYALSEDSPHLFASPLGPFYFGGRHATVPRLVFFGPHASDDSWRLCFLAGFDHRDLRPSHALLALAERLAEDVETGHGLNLSLFPVVDAAGLFLGFPDRALRTIPWGSGGAPEIELLERDSRARSYHGFIRVETAPPGDDIASIQVRAPRADPLSPDLELISSEDTDPVPVRFEAATPGPAGPLSLTEDLPFAPFELTLRLPGQWTNERYQRTAAILLQRFLWRYRAFQAYGLHL